MKVLSGKRSFIVNRSGKIKLDNSDANQCKDVGHQDYSYHVAATCPPRLNPRGFVIDHTDIHNAVQSVREAGSCELLCEAIQTAIENIMYSQEVCVNKLYIKITPLITIGEKQVRVISQSTSLGYFYKYKNEPVFEDSLAYTELVVNY